MIYFLLLSFCIWFIGALNFIIAGVNLSKLCVGSVDMDRDLIHIAILYQGASVS
jgi:hypothetical protein